MRLNLGAVLHVTHAYVGAMVDAGWGRVVTIVSDAGRRGRAHAGDLRRGQGRGDGLHAGASRPRSARTASPSTASRSAR